MIKNLDTLVITADAPCIFTSRGTYRDLGGCHQEIKVHMTNKKEINASYY